MPERKMLFLAPRRRDEDHAAAAVRLLHLQGAGRPVDGHRAEVGDLAHKAGALPKAGVVVAAPGEGRTFNERFDIEFTPIFQPNDQTLRGSFSFVSKPIFATKY